MQEARERMQEARERMQEARERMHEARERMLAKEVQEVDNEDDEEVDEEWVDCENVEYENVEYSCCDGEASAAFLLDSDIEHLVIPEVITDEDGNKYTVTEFDIDDVESVTNVTLPSAMKRVYGCAFSCNTNVVVDFSGEPELCFENGIFYSKDKKELQNAKLANIKGEYTVEEGVEEIAVDAFGDCKNLTVLNLPSTIKTINPAFRGCSALQIVNIYADAANVVFCNLDRDEEEVVILPNSVQVNYLKPTKVAEEHVTMAPAVKIEPKKQKEEKQNARRLALSLTDKKIAGVCGGIASWLGVNSIVIRIIAFFTYGFFFWGYILLWILMPRDNSTTNVSAPKIKSSDRTRDYSQYSVNGAGSYGKGRMVEAVVNKYVELNPGTTVQKLKEVFPEHLQGSNFIKDSSERITDMKRYYESALPGGAKFYISNQWGVQTDGFVAYVNENIDGITVTKV